jgi:uncharacterized repeat protein (TIGR03803 family)
LFGTTDQGGAYGYGTVFELMPVAGGGWTEKILHNFMKKPADGNYPNTGVIFDNAGNLYGTTSYGGTHDAGIAFELVLEPDGSWSEKILHNFEYGRADGSHPQNLIFDNAGNLYGTTAGAGGGVNCDGYGCGVAFELMPGGGGIWTEKILHNFNNDGKDGLNPPGSALTFDKRGNLYGNTGNGGTGEGGTVYELSPQANGSWTEQILHAFIPGRLDGYGPFGNLIFDENENLYGVTYWGGANGATGEGDGIVFELSPAANGAWNETILYNFDHNAPNPFSGLTFDESGNLYGTTNGANYGPRTVFELIRRSDGAWSLKPLYLFSGTRNACDGGLIIDGSGNLYGTTTNGGAYDYYGTVFKIARN